MAVLKEQKAVLKEQIATIKLALKLSENDYSPITKTQGKSVPQYRGNLLIDKERILKQKLESLDKKQRLLGFKGNAPSEKNIPFFLWDKTTEQRVSAINEEIAKLDEKIVDLDQQKAVLDQQINNLKSK